MTRLAVLLVGLFSASAPAFATSGLVWRWDPAGETRFFLQTRTYLSEVMMFRAEQNLDVRVGEFWVDVVTTCKPVDIGKRAATLTCTLDDVLVRAEPVAADADRLPGVLAEFDQRLTGAGVQLVLTHDGRITSFDVEGLPKTNQRTVDQAETLRLITMRAFAAFDLQLPKAGDDKGKGEWAQRESVALWFPSRHGTLGSAQLRHRVAGVEGAKVSLDSDGRALLGTGAMIAVGGAEQPANMYQVTYESGGLFDTEVGGLIERSYSVRAVPTASSQSAEGFSGLEYVSGSGLRRLQPGEVVPPLGDSRPISEADRAL